MTMKQIVRQMLSACMPETMRIGYRKWKGQDVIRSGRWLFRQAENHFSSNAWKHRWISSSNLRDWMILPVDTWQREQGEKQILAWYAFSFETMLIVVNPYARTPLSALLLFRTDRPYYVRYRVLGRNGDDFTYTSSRAARNHRIPVFGLYAGCRNNVMVELLDGEMKKVAARKVYIETDALPDKLNGVVKPVFVDDETAMPFVFVTGGITGSTYAFDRNGDVRYYLSRTPRQYGVYPMPDGRFLFPERNVNRPTYINAHANILYEMDYLGRVNKTCYVEDGIHHWAEVLPGTKGHKIVAAGSSLKERMEDLILVYDRNDGKITRKVDLGEVFPAQFVNRFDWAHMNCVVCCNQTQVLVSLRNLHTVAKIDISKREIVWILAHPGIYEGTEVEDKVLRPVGDEFHFFYQQHAVELLGAVETEGAQESGTQNIMLFDNHCVTKREAPWFDGKEESYVCFYQVDEKKGIVKNVRNFACDLSPTRSNAWFDSERRRVFAMAGAANAECEESVASICEWDFDSGKLISRYEIHEGFFKAYPFEVKDEGLSQYLDITSDFCKGTMAIPVRCEQLRDTDCQELDGLEQLLNFGRMDDLILIRAKDHKLEKIFLQGEHTWVKDYTDTYQRSAVFEKKHYYVAVSVKPLPPGEYKVLVQYEGNMFHTGKWFMVP